MKHLTLILLTWGLCACMSQSKTFETELLRKQIFLDGSSDIRSSSDISHDTVYLSEVSICGYLREAAWHKGQKFSNIDINTADLNNIVLNTSDSILTTKNSILNTSEHINLIGYQCDILKADQNWGDYVSDLLAHNSNLRSDLVNMKIIGRIVTYSSPELADTSSPHVMASSGNTEYFISIRWIVVIHEGDQVVYRGSALSKDFLVQPTSKDFAYSPSKQIIDSLMFISLKDYIQHE